MAGNSLTPLQKAIMLKEHYVTLANWVRTQLGTRALLRMGDIVNNLDKLPNGKTVAKRWGCMLIPLLEGFSIGQQYALSFRGFTNINGIATFNTSDNTHRYLAMQFGFRDTTESQEDPDDPESNWLGIPFVVVAMLAWDIPSEQWRIENSVAYLGSTASIGATLDTSDVRLDNLIGTPDTISSLSLIWPSQEIEFTYNFPAINLNVEEDTETIIKQNLEGTFTIEIPGYGEVTKQAYVCLDRIMAIAPVAAGQDVK